MTYSFKSVKLLVFSPPPPLVYLAIVHKFSISEKSALFIGHSKYIFILQRYPSAHLVGVIRYPSANLVRA